MESDHTGTQGQIYVSVQILTIWYPHFNPHSIPPKRNMIILTIVRSYILLFFPCKNDTLDTLDMSPFGSTKNPFIWYIQIYPSHGETQRIPIPSGWCSTYPGWRPVGPYRAALARWRWMEAWRLTLGGLVGRKGRTRVKQTQLGGIA